jgi:hypothetical protein
MPALEHPHGVVAGEGRVDLGQLSAQAEHEAGKGGESGKG